jgi:hypothetical protein
VLLLPVARGAAQVASDAADPPAAKTSRGSVPRTADGRPDLQGLWSNATTTPLERPATLAGKQELTDEERAALQEEVNERVNADRPPRAGDPGTYNEFWWERGTNRPDVQSSVGQLLLEIDARVALNVSP